MTVPDRIDSVKNMLQASMVRPDEIMRSGIVQPFSVQTDPVQYARQEIDPFIAAVRPEGSQYIGPLGIVRAAQVPTLGVWNDPVNTKWWILGSIVAGLAAGYTVSRVLKKGKRRR